MANQVIVLITPHLPPTYEYDSDDPFAVPDPMLEFQRLNAPTSELYTLLPEHTWTPSPISAILGLPLKVTYWLGSDAKRTSNPALLAFSMTCDFESMRDFGKCEWTSVLGGMMVARVDGEELDVRELQAMIVYLNQFGEDVKAVKTAVEAERARRENVEEVRKKMEAKKAAVAESKRMGFRRGRAAEPVVAKSTKTAEVGGGALSTKGGGGTTKEEPLTEERIQAIEAKKARRAAGMEEKAELRAERLRPIANAKINAEAFCTFCKTFKPELLDLPLGDGEDGGHSD